MSDTELKLLLEFLYWSFTLFSTLFQLYHGDSSPIHVPWVNKQILGLEMCLAQGLSTMTAATGDRTQDARFQIPDANHSATEDS